MTCPLPASCASNPLGAPGTAAAPPGLDSRVWMSADHPVHREAVASSCPRGHVSKQWPLPANSPHRPSRAVPRRSRVGRPCLGLMGNGQGMTPLWLRVDAATANGHGLPLSELSSGHFVHAARSGYELERPSAPTAKAATCRSTPWRASLVRRLLAASRHHPRGAHSPRTPTTSSGDDSPKKRRCSHALQSGCAAVTTVDRR